MSSDLERRLRDVGKALRGPAPTATDRARETALAAAAPAPSRRRSGAIAIGGAVLAAVALGIAIGSFAFAGRGAAAGPQGLGFLPADGWTVLQSATPATSDRPGVALAANVPLHPQDTIDGFPYSTLRTLPPHGVVLVASFMRLDNARVASQSLPLSLRDATPYIRYGGEVRPRKPLGQYELGALVEGYAVEVQAYFGTRKPSDAVVAEAQRQLDRLVVSPKTDDAVPRAPARADTVTIAFQRYWYPPGNYFTMRFFGTISSGQAGEYVAVLKKECGATFSTAIAGATTTAGGGWEAVPNAPPGGGEFRAKWNDELSEPVTYRPPAEPWLEKVAPGKFRATVTSYTPPGGKPRSMTGRRIDLQRLSAGQWIRMRSAKLVRKKSSTDNFYRTFIATFTVAAKGLRLRAYVPAETAAPCFAAGASKPVKS